MLFRNPFFQVEKDRISPVKWSQNDLQAFTIVSDTTSSLPRSHAPRDVTELQGSIGMHNHMEFLRDFRSKKNLRHISRLTTKMISHFSAFVGMDKNILVSRGDAAQLFLNGENFRISYSHSCNVDEIPLFRVVDGAFLNEDRIEPDPLDIASMLALATKQVESKVPGDDGIFTVRFMYPDLKLDDSVDRIDVVVLTARVPGVTLTALKEGSEFLEPVLISRETVKLGLNTDWANNELFQVIAGIVEEGDKISKSRPLEAIPKGNRIVWE